MDRNRLVVGSRTTLGGSLSARRAWIEILLVYLALIRYLSLSARRAWIEIDIDDKFGGLMSVALRKESVDRNTSCTSIGRPKRLSLSARRAWIEINVLSQPSKPRFVALRKESVDRNSTYVARLPRCQVVALRKESVDRNTHNPQAMKGGIVALRKESVDRNFI